MPQFTFGQAFADSFNRARAERARRVLQRERLKAGKERLKKQLQAADDRQRRSLQAKEDVQEDQQDFAANQNRLNRKAKQALQDDLQEHQEGLAKIRGTNQLSAVETRNEGAMDRLLAQLQAEDPTANRFPEPSGFTPYDAETEVNTLPEAESVFDKTVSGVSKGVSTITGPIRDIFRDPLQGEKERVYTDRINEFETQATTLLDPEGAVSDPRTRARRAARLAGQVQQAMQRLNEFHLEEETRERLFGRLRNITSQLGQVRPQENPQRRVLTSLNTVAMQRGHQALRNGNPEEARKWFKMVDTNP